MIRPTPMVLLGLLMAGITTAGDDQLDRRTLKGLKGVYVLIENLDDDAQRFGLSRHVIQIDVEVKLRLAGIPVLARDETLKSPGSPHLYVNAQVMKLLAQAYVACLTVELRQAVVLHRNPAISAISSTWAVESLHTMRTWPNGPQHLRDQIKDRVDQFINAWLSVNPKNP